MSIRIGQLFVVAGLIWSGAAGASPSDFVLDRNISNMELTKNGFVQAQATDWQFTAPTEDGGSARYLGLSSMTSGQNVIVSKFPNGKFKSVISTTADGTTVSRFNNLEQLESKTYCNSARCVSINRKMCQAFQERDIGLKKKKLQECFDIMQVYNRAVRSSGVENFIRIEKNMVTQEATKYGINLNPEQFNPTIENLTANVRDIFSVVVSAASACSSMLGDPVLADTPSAIVPPPATEVVAPAQPEQPN